MTFDLIILGAVLLTLAYTLAGLRVLLHIDAVFGARYLPRTNLGTYLSIVAWPVAFAAAAIRSRLRCNRRLS
jgi:hypothetical protein